MDKWNEAKVAKGVNEVVILRLIAAFCIVYGGHYLFGWPHINILAAWLFCVHLGEAHVSYEQDVELERRLRYLEKISQTFHDQIRVSSLSQE